MRANVIGLLLIANVFYLFRSDPKAAPSRVVKLPNLWIDAKEQELKDRVRANKISAVAVVVPENLIRADSRHEVESAHYST